MPFLPTAPARIQPYFGYRNRDRLRITGRALRSRAERFETRSRWRAVRTMLSQFASHEVAGLPVELEIAFPGGPARRHQGLTDSEGYVHFDIRLDPEWAYGPRPAWETVVFHWKADGAEQCVDGHVFAPGSDTSLAVISDIDDTIIETGITGNIGAVLRNWRRLLVEMPVDRILVPGADVFYNALGGGEALDPGEGHAGAIQAATNRPFFYVSSSPWNLFSYLVAYIRDRKLPLGPIFLRDWGFNRKTLGSGSHGVHKRESIDALLAAYPEMKFALIGDDSQGDLVAFAQVALAHTERVRAIFIRKLGEAMTAEELAARKELEQAGIPLWLGSSYDSGHEFLASLGLLSDGEAMAVMDTIESGEPQVQGHK